MLKYILPALLLFQLQVQAQIERKANWSAALSATDYQIGDELEVVFNVDIADDWYLYSSDFDPELGPTVTTISFSPDESFELIDGLKAINPSKKYDDIFEGDITYFKKKGVFKQKLKVLKKELRLQGQAEYQVCSDITGMCIQETFDFEIGKKKTISNGADQDTIKENSSSDNKQGDYGLWSLAIAAFLAGLAALLTPCVFPMIPMTVSIFLKGGQMQEDKKKARQQGIIKALVYGFSIIAIYTIIGTVISLVFGPDFANWLSTHWLPNLLFFGVFVFFALSFLGMFEIVLPSSWVNKVDKQSVKGGYYGVFFMAFTLVLVSFSCTGPIVGSILIASSQGEFIRPIVGMLGFSLAFALPFTLFALFPSALRGLPKSGGWLNAVKVILGFLELALALKFLSQADLVYHWGLLDRDIFIAIWIAIFALMGFYLLGKIQLPHDSKPEKISVPRFMLALLTFSFVIYMLPGLIGANLSALSGILPPKTTHNFDIASLLSTYSGASNEHQPDIEEEIKYADLFKFPYGIKGFFDYEQGMRYAQQVNKPVFIDFTGHGCANCRRMEEKVWVDPRVLQMLKNDYVVIGLYVDDKTTLPEKDWYTSKVDGKVKKSIGKQHLDFQISKFNANAQPYYCLLDNQGELLIAPKAYDPDPDHFVDFLREGLEKYQETDQK